MFLWIVEIRNVLWARRKIQNIGRIERSNRRLYIYYYNNKRIKEKLKGLTPASYRSQSLLVS